MRRGSNGYDRVTRYMFDVVEKPALVKVFILLLNFGERLSMNAFHSSWCEILVVWILVWILEGSERKNSNRTLSLTVTIELQ